ncbi:RNA polymerase subunit sigma-70 [Labedaea rhizosphaerae]|uniref:RNA polymerase sigma factor n=1 Tax=Labedaea rhizosphaerae TaxID=598644 RepID=A0A4R6RUG1_LABRH|nr:RNA polymerase subunit sigma-70 [Labedaea rhizosphaerae]TDP89905.1 RNA polymerase ECF family sigma subunit [Labedaea rhizosphaerae]
MEGETQFAARTESLRGELLAHCYRMLGSVDDAEDVVQETLLNAWRAWETFAGRSSLRTWLYRIATNACLSALRGRARRVLPSGLGPPGEDPHAPIQAAGPGVRWLQPVPDALVTPASDDPAVAAVAREDLRLALIACLQYVPPRQRAVFLLREVLGFSAPEVAEMLGVSVAAVKSSLQRARANLDAAPADAEPPAEAEQRVLLQEYIAAFENADAAAFERLLRADAALEFPPAATWFAGRRRCVPCLARTATTPGEWRMFPTTANGQPAAVSYRRGEDGVLHAYGVAVLTIVPGGIARITAFGDPGLVRRFAMPTTYSGGLS